MQTWTVFWKYSGTAAVNRFSAVFRGTETERWGMIAKRKKRVLQKTITVHLRFLYFYHLCFLRGTRTGNSVLSHSSLKLDTAIGSGCSFSWSRNTVPRVIVWWLRAPAPSRIVLQVRWSWTSVLSWSCSNFAQPSKILAWKQETVQTAL